MLAPYPRFTPRALALLLLLWCERSSSQDLRGSALTFQHGKSIPRSSMNPIGDSESNGGVSVIDQALQSKNDQVVTKLASQHPDHPTGYQSYQTPLPFISETPSPEQPVSSLDSKGSIAARNSQLTFTESDLESFGGNEVSAIIARKAALIGAVESKSTIGVYNDRFHYGRAPPEGLTSVRSGFPPKNTMGRNNAVIRRKEAANTALETAPGTGKMPPPLPPTITTTSASSSTTTTTTTKGAPAAVLSDMKKTDAYLSTQASLRKLPPRSDGKDREVTVVFAADSRYFRFVLPIIEKIRKDLHGESYRILVYSLGFSDSQLHALRCRIPQLVDDVRIPNWRRKPPHLKSRHTYAWKPTILADVWREFNTSSIVWLDSGVLLDGPSKFSDKRDFIETAVDEAARRGGALSDATAGTLVKWTHNKTFEYFEKRWGWSREDFRALRPKNIQLKENPKGNMLNCNGAFSAWTHEDTREESPRAIPESKGTPLLAMSPYPSAAASSGAFPGLGQRAMDLWEACALDKACVAPAGSNRGNHRQDQAALSLVLAMHGVFCDRKSFVHPHGVKGGRANAKLVLGHFQDNSQKSGGDATCADTGNPSEKR